MATKIFLPYICITNPVLLANGETVLSFIQKRRETRLPDPLATFHYAKGANSYPPLALAGAGQMIRVPWKIPPLSLFSPPPLRLLRVMRLIQLDVDSSRHVEVRHEAVALVGRHESSALIRVMPALCVKRVDVSTRNVGTSEHDAVFSRQKEVLLTGRIRVTTRSKDRECCKAIVKFARRTLTSFDRRT